jgi:hypothetical protein
MRRPRALPARLAEAAANASCRREIMVSAHDLHRADGLACVERNVSFVRSRQTLAPTIRRVTITSSRRQAAETQQIQLMAAVRFVHDRFELRAHGDRRGLSLGGDVAQRAARQEE